MCVCLAAMYLALVKLGTGTHMCHIHTYGYIGTVILCPYKLTTWTCEDFLWSQQLLLAMTLCPQNLVASAWEAVTGCFHLPMHSCIHLESIHCESSVFRALYQTPRLGDCLSSQGVRWRFNFFQVEPGCVGEKGFVAGVRRLCSCFSRNSCLSTLTYLHFQNRSLVFLTTPSIQSVSCSVVFNSLRPHRL